MMLIAFEALGGLPESSNLKLIYELAPGRNQTLNLSICFGSAQQQYRAGIHISECAGFSYDKKSDASVMGVKF
ncbi:hypothetical protein SK128_026779 [Halocaridina rubra]|uniref:Uncharacterized protein n=1 Tax=Halocaridina rubra TaxID=373956 RepID=A0AAN9A6T6_HALRR